MTTPEILQWPGSSGIKVASAITCLILCTAAFALGQDFALEWWTIDGGGGASTGGPFAVIGTTGQPDAGKMSGGAFTLEGGFWPGVLAARPSGTAPVLCIQASEGGNLLLWWPAEGAPVILEKTADLSAPTWKPCPGGNPVSIPLTGSAQFFRLRKL